MNAMIAAIRSKLRGSDDPEDFNIFRSHSLKRFGEFMSPEAPMNLDSWSVPQDHVFFDLSEAGSASQATIDGAEVQRCEQ